MILLISSNFCNQIIFKNKRKNRFVCIEKFKTIRVFSTIRQQEEYVFRFYNLYIIAELFEN